MSLEKKGFCHVPTCLPVSTLEALRKTIFSNDSAGQRCLLDHPSVRETSLALKRQLVATGHLDLTAVAIQAIAFDKTPGTNWKVAWHQDLMFPFAAPVSSPGFDLASIKQGVPYARPPVPVLQRLLAVRLHLDDCGPDNGPLRVSHGTHLDGILDSREIPETVARHGEMALTATAGEALLMRPLLLHASSKATRPDHRRILHLVYDSGGPIDESWHRAI